MKQLLFDFDGVIVDSFKISVDTAQHFEPTLTAETYRRMFDGNVYTNFVNRQLSPEEKAKFVRDWFAVYAPKLSTRQPVAGMPEVIKTLAQTHALTIISSGSTEGIKRFLLEHALDSYIQDVLGVEVNPSKTEKIQSVLDANDAPATDALFVTDTLGDIREAARIPVASIGVTWGFHAPEDLRKGNPLHIVKTTEELLETIERHFGEQS